RRAGGAAGGALDGGASRWRNCTTGQRPGKQTAREPASIVREPNRRRRRGDRKEERDRNAAVAAGGSLCGDARRARDPRLARARLLPAAAARTPAPSSSLGAQAGRQ